jgi:hypothetical protein
VRARTWQAAILARSTQLTEQHRNYLAKHPALTQLMHDLLTNVLVNKPDDCYQFCQVLWRARTAVRVRTGEVPNMREC